MPEPRKQLPPALVSVAGYKLVRAFARDADMSLSDAIRQLLKESPRLIEFARKQGVDVDVLDVNPWGRVAEPNEEDEDAEPSNLIIDSALTQV
jgi:hypothetical protein